MSSGSVDKDKGLTEPVDIDVAKVEEGRNYAAIDKQSERSYGMFTPYPIKRNMRTTKNLFRCLSCSSEARLLSSTFSIPSMFVVGSSMTKTLAELTELPARCISSTQSIGYVQRFILF